MKKIILFLVIIVSITEGCKRFEDGPTISLCSVKSRITGTWKVDKFYIDGADSTDEYYFKLGCEMKFTKENYNSYGYNTIYIINCKNGNMLKGHWKFLHNPNRLNIYFNENPYFTSPIGPIVSDRSGYWTIIRLTNNEFNLTLTNWPDINGVEKTYLLQLKK